MNENSELTLTETSISKDLKKLILEAGGTSFDVRWSGGSDEAYLDVELRCFDGSVHMLSEDHPGLQPLKVAQDLIFEAAEDGFDYSGAGDGSDYGDDYTYDLLANTITHQEWYMVQKDEEPTQSELEVES